MAATNVLQQIEPSNSMQDTEHTIVAAEGRPGFTITLETHPEPALKQQPFREWSISTSPFHEVGAADVGVQDTKFGSREFDRSLPVRTQQLVPNHHLLTNNNRRLLRILQSIVLSKAIKSSLDIERFSIDVETDPEEGASRIALRVYTGNTGAQTLAFWDSLEIELGSWFGRLRTVDRRAVVDTIGLRFHWQV